MFTVHSGCDLQSMIWNGPVKLRDNETALHLKLAGIWGGWRQTREKCKGTRERAKEQATSINMWLVE